MTADRVTKWAPISPASSRARLVLPVPGGPHRSVELRWPRATLRRSGPRSPTRCSWPTNSARVRGRIRAARGWRSGGGWKSASGRAPPDRAAGGRRLATRSMVRGPTGPARRLERLEREEVEPVHEDVEDGEDREEEPADEHDPSDVALDVGVLVGRPYRQRHRGRRHRRRLGGRPTAALASLARGGRRL